MKIDRLALIGVVVTTFALAACSQNTATPSGAAGGDTPNEDALQVLFTVQ